jgi:hypothetical protein
MDLYFNGRGEYSPSVGVLIIKIRFEDHPFRVIYNYETMSELWRDYCEKTT